MSEPRSDQPSRQSRVGWLNTIILPPDFSPERKNDALTWAEAVFEPIALVVVVLCFILSIVQFGLAIFPEWPTSFVIPLLALVGFEGFFYSRRLDRSIVRPREWLVLLAPPIILVRVLPNLGDANSPDTVDVIRWLANPLSIFSASFVVDTFLIFLVWSLAVWCAQLLNGLRVQPGEIIEETDSRRRQILEDNWRAVDHSGPLRRLGELFVYGCLIVVFLSALASLGVDQFGSIAAIGEIIGFQRPSIHLVLANVVGFVVVGLLLLGEAHYVRQRTLWRIDRLAVSPAVSANWGGGLVGLLVVGLVIAFILPTSYAVTLGELVTGIAGIAAQAMFLVLSLIFYLIGLIGSLLGTKTSAESPGAPATPPKLPPATPTPTTGNSVFDLLGSVVFWIVVLAIVGYSLSVIWRRRPAWTAQFSLAGWLVGPWNFLRSMLRLMRRVGRDVGLAVMSAIPRIFRSGPAPIRALPGFISLSRLGPRELVEYYYLSICERAARLGYPRLADETPDEYQAGLRARLPIVDPEIEVLTAAFLEARYGPRPTTRERAKQLRGGWESLKKKLRSARLTRSRST